jgi:hypothetical protein
MSLEATLEQYRRIGLRLDRQGRFWHQGELVAHHGLAAALHRWLDRLDDGRYVVRLDAERYAYVEVEDAPYQVRSIAIERGAEGEPGLRVFLALSDGSEEELAYGTLGVGADDALYCRVKGGRFEARFGRPAYYLLGELIEGEEDERGAPRFVLRAAGERWPIASRA